MQERLHESERAKDRAEMRLEIMGTRGNTNLAQAQAPIAFDGTPQPNFNPSGPGRRKRFVHQEIKYQAEDGGFTYYDTDGSETDSEYEKAHLRKHRRVEDRSSRGKHHYRPHLRSSNHGGSSTSRAPLSRSAPVTTVNTAGNGVEVSVTPGRTPRISFLVNPTPAKLSNEEQPEVILVDEMHVDE